MPDTAVGVAQLCLGEGRVFSHAAVNGFWGIAGTPAAKVELAPPRIILAECARANELNKRCWILAWCPGLSAADTVARLQQGGKKLICRHNLDLVKAGEPGLGYEPGYRLFDLKMSCLNYRYLADLEGAVLNLGPQFRLAHDWALAQTLMLLVGMGRTDFALGSVSDCFHQSNWVNRQSQRRLIFGGIGQGSLRLHDDWACVAPQKLGVVLESSLE